MTPLFNKPADRAAPTLEELARAKFLKLSDAELRLVRAAPEGKLAQCGEPNAPASANDPAQAVSWNPRREIRADLIRWLCVDSDAKAKIDPSGIQVARARIVGELDLSFASVDFPIALIHCGIMSPLNFFYADLQALNLGGSHARGVSLTGARVKRGLFFDQSFTSDGCVKLFGAHIGGNLDCSGAKLLGDPIKLSDGSVSRSRALWAENATIDGGVFLRNGFSAEGQVSVYGARINGDLECIGATLQGQFEPQQDGTTRLGRSLWAERVKTAGHVLLRSAIATGEVNLCAAEIGGNLECDGGTFANQQGYALIAERARVTGNVFLRTGFKAAGTVFLLGADIGGNLQCPGATFSNPGAYAFVGDGMKVRGSVSLNSRFRSDGEVSLNSAEVGELDCRGATLTNPDGLALVADSIKIAGTLLLSDNFSATGQVRLIGALVGAYIDSRGSNFANAVFNLPLVKVASLLDDPDSWPAAGNLYLDGFVYDRIGMGPVDTKSRLEWIRRQLPSDESERADRFRPEPYRQLAKVMRQQGKSDDATAVLIGLEDDRRKYGGMSVAGRASGSILKWTIAYGYRPLRALWYIAAFVVAGFLIFGAAYRAGALVPSNQDAYASFAANKSIPYYESFCAIVYSFDTFVPIIDLGQRSQWKPIDSAKDALAKVSADGDSKLGCFICQASPLTSLWHPPIWFVRFFRFIDIVAGWFFTSLFVAGISGLVRND